MGAKAEQALTAEHLLSGNGNSSGGDLVTEPESLVTKPIGNKTLKPTFWRS
jgi:hypothetical protein